MRFTLRHQIAGTWPGQGRGVGEVTRCPKAIYGHRYPCPAFDFFCVTFYVSRAAAPEGTGGDSVLYDDFWNLIKALSDTFEVGNQSQSRAPAAWLEILEKEIEA